VGRNSPPRHRWALQSRSPRLPVVPLRNPHTPSHLHLRSLLLAHHLGNGLYPCLTTPPPHSCAQHYPRSPTITAKLLLPWNLSKYTQASNLPSLSSGLASPVRWPSQVQPPGGTPAWPKPRAQLPLTSDGRGRTLHELG